MNLISTSLLSYRGLAGRSLRPGLLLIVAWLLHASAFAQLALPFFDDFSTAQGRPGLDRPDPARWQPGSGVYINNTLAINQPTVNVASFDGLRADGLPYVRNNQFSQGYTDTLASLPINLGGLTPADSVYLSFYWQIRGLGEAPDPGDSLTLQFRDQAGAWRTVWFAVGGEPNNNFNQVFVAVRSANYLHAGFQFRFRSFGRESGPFDTWSIDYIYLNRGRTVGDRFVKDVAARQAPGPLLKRYSAMPLTQFLVNPAAELADSVTTDINNLFNNFNFTTYRFTVRDELTGQVLQDTPNQTSVLIQGLSSQVKSTRPSFTGAGLGAAARAVLRYKFDVLTTDDQNPSIPGVNLRQNDTISGVATLDDYYAYDDGTAEFGVQIGPRERWAVRFVASKPDVVSGVRVCVLPFRTNQSGQPFVLTVYSNSNGRPGTAVYQKSFATQYPPNRNGFVDLRFDRSISVRDTFYIGYQQISISDTTFFRIGFDKNSPFGNQIFYNGGSSWDQNLSTPALNLRGAFMLRPVMGGRPDTVVTSLPQPEAIRPLMVFPNPTSGVIRWENERLTRIDVLDLSGRLLYELTPARGQETADLGHLRDGLYLLRLSDDRRTVVQKLIIQK